MQRCIARLGIFSVKVVCHFLFILRRLAKYPLADENEYQQVDKKGNKKKYIFSRECAYITQKMRKIGKSNLTEAYEASRKSIEAEEAPKAKQCVQWLAFDGRWRFFGCEVLVAEQVFALEPKNNQSPNSVLKKTLETKTVGAQCPLVVEFQGRVGKQ